MGNSKKSGIVASAAHALSRFGVKSTSSVLAAVSGGVDSMTLVFILNELRRQGHLKKLSIIHINHSLRGRESDKDEVLVKQFAKKSKIPISTFKVNTRSCAIAKKIGIEEAARHLRYEKIGEVASAKKIDFVATAHTANDLAETVLMNIVRGSGLNGLQGIPESRKFSAPSVLIRPMLEINKQDIIAFAKENNIPFLDDQSNESFDFQRNRVRHLVLPALEKAFKDRDIYSGFTKAAQNINSTLKHIEIEVEALLEKAVMEQPSLFVERKMTTFEKKPLLAAPDFIRRELLLREASALSGKMVSIDHIHSALVESYVSYQSNKTFPLTKEIILAHDGRYITIENIDNPPTHSHQLHIGKKIMSPVGLIAAKKVKGWGKPQDSNTAYFNYEDIKGRTLLIRFWKPGDKMKPFGMKGKSRLVSDILSEAGIKTERLKYFVPLIVFEDEPEFILWIPGIRSAEFGILLDHSETALELKRIIC